MESLHAVSGIKKNLGHLLPEYIDKVEKAFNFAKKAHLGQYRTSGEPYISHPLAVANILAMLDLDHETIISGLLHDVVEDTGVKEKEIEDLFGENVALIVQGVTKLRRLHYVSAESYHAENYRKMFMAMANDIRVIFVKLADRLHNMRTCMVVPVKTKTRISRETLDVYAPIANRLGMHNMSLELYELGFAASYPFRYAVLLERMYRFTSGHQSVLTHLRKQIFEQAKAQGIHISDISSREKRLYGIYEKMKMKKLHFSDLMDVYALRICVGNVQDCYHLLGMVHGLYRPKERLFKDYIASPKENGYQSLHTVLHGPYGLSIEIQIRSEEMHLVATKGVAAHWVYKSGTSSNNQRKHEEWFKKLIKVQEFGGNDAEYLKSLRQQITLEEVYVLTPKGKVMELKRGATVLDMAYHIHTDLGNHAVYAEVDMVISPLSQILMNGQRVNIHTDSKIFPKENWLNMVVTAKARSAIRHSLKERKIMTERMLGEQALKRALFIRDINEVEESILEALIHGEGIISIDELYEGIALDRLEIEFITDQYLRLSQKTEVAHKKPYIVVGAELEEDMKFGECCYPIPGDKIVCTMVENQVFVHRVNCRNLRRSGHQLLLAKWENSTDKMFACLIQVFSSYHCQSLSYIVSILNDKLALIEEVAINRETENKCYLFKIRVKSLDHLEMIVLRLNKVNEILDVRREL